MDLIPQKILDIEKEIRETPYHKATEHHIGKLRARLARLKDKQLEAMAKAKGGGGGGYSIKKQGDATVVLIGPPSSGKSTLINKLTSVESKVAAYDFTTTSIIPGMMKYKDAYIQILDVPGLIKGASLGKGKGKEVISVARAADLLLIITEVKREGIFPILSSELESAGIRINKTPPNIKISKKTSGGIEIQTNFKQKLSKDTIREIISEMGVKNAAVLLKQVVEVEDLIDALSANRIYLPALYLVNKIDTAAGYFNEDALLISAEKGTGLEKLKQSLWEKLNLLRVYLVRVDDKPNFDSPIIMKKGQNLLAAAEKIGTEFAAGKSTAKIWGPSAQFPGQEVPLSFPISENLQIKFI